MAHPALPTLCLLASYVLGCLPSADIVGRRYGFEPRLQGSFNPGATNALRLGGSAAGIQVLLIDVAKGAVAAALGMSVGSSALAAVSGIAVVLGHTHPVTNGMRGGKGVATAAGVALVISPTAVPWVVTAFALSLLITRMVSFSSLLSAAILPIVTALMGGEPVTIAATTVLALLVAGRHRGNIARIRSGSEPKLGRKSHSEEAECSVRSERQ